MLDLNYVRENLEKVRTALETRGVASEVLDSFAEADGERRRIIAESDQLNAARNVTSREIGALMKEGKREEAEARREEVNHLKVRIAAFARICTHAPRRLHGLPSPSPTTPPDGRRA